MSVGSCDEAEVLFSGCSRWQLVKKMCDSEKRKAEEGEEAVGLV